MQYYFFLSYITVYAQNPHQYYPHQVGNLWQYIDDEGRITNKIFLRDSADGQGNTFVNTIENPAFPNLTYWDYKFNATGDTVFEQPNSYNYLVYKFPMDSGDVWVADSVNLGVIAKVKNKIRALVFGIPTTVLYITYYPDTNWVHWMWHEEFALGIGTVWWGDEVSYKNLMGCIINGVQLGTILDIDDKIDYQPTEFQLYQNYPNPFNPETTISYSIPRYGQVTLKIYDILGNELTTIINKYQSSGKYTVNFNADNLASGIYIYRLHATDFIQSKKMILIK